MDFGIEPAFLLKTQSLSTRFFENIL